jgi:dCTP deaminase
MFIPSQMIRARCSGDRPLIAPFSERTEFGGTTYGLGPAGYDLRIDRDVTLWPGRSVRADAMESICMPLDLIGLLFSKSTWARVHVEHAGTVIDPGFEGVLRLEINMHHGDGIITIPAGTGIVQVLFALLAEPTDEPYRGRYFGQGADTDAIFVP